MRWKDFLYFQRGSRLAVLLLMILIVLTLILQILLTTRRSSEFVLQQNDSLIRAFELFRRSGQVVQPDTAGHNERSGKERKIVSHGNRRGEAAPPSVERKHPEYPAYPVTVKLRPGETISLNESDTSRWKMIPGIGSTYAARIVGYRELLGGYVCMDQLQEVYGVDAELYARISHYITPDSLYRRLPVNRAAFSDLLRHPYLNYEQVKAIVNLRRKKGDIQSIRELAMLDQFTDADIIRMEPYLEF